MKFKIGDWVRSKGSTNKNDGNEELLIKQLRVQQQVDIINKYQSEWEHWQPKENEYILATDGTKVYLAQFLGMNYEKFVCSHLDGFSEAFTKIEPFLSELPSIVKEK